MSEIKHVVCDNCKCYVDNFYMRVKLLNTDFPITEHFKDFCSIECLKKYHPDLKEKRFIELTDKES